MPKYTEPEIVYAMARAEAHDDFARWSDECLVQDQVPELRAAYLAFAFPELKLRAPLDDEGECNA